jgi:cell wall-associated NlpC family hydrolase
MRLAGSWPGSSVEHRRREYRTNDQRPIPSLVAHFPFARLGSRALSMTLAVLAGGCAVGPASAVAGTSPAASWDAAQQRQVIGAGLMAESAGSFNGAGRLSAAQANAAMAALASRLQTAASEQGPQGEPSEGSEQSSSTGSEPSATSMPVTSSSVTPVAHTSQSSVTVVTFDRMIVEDLGLTSVAAHVQAVASSAGLRPPSYFGSEVAARFLELRYEHPVGSQRLDLFPAEPITRAEAAWSLSRVMDLNTWSISQAEEDLSAFALPSMSPAQRQALQIAVSRIGYPYVWGGTTDNTADGLEHGGFDCSGFAWRVYKVSGLPWGNEIRGRTAAEQAGEIPSSQRLNTGQLQPGDLIFFGSAHFNSKATESNVIHEGIYLGDNWVIHSSGQGVYVLPLSGSWLGSSFAWGRRVIR